MKKDTEWIKYLWEKGINISEDAPFPTTVRIMIDKEFATALLKRNYSNRKILQRHLTRLKRIVLDGEWKETGESIKLDKNGDLIDGQHRLTVTAELDVSLPFSLTYNCEREIIYSLDTGKNRTLTHTLKIMGYKYSDLIASTIKGALLGQKLTFKSYKAQESAICSFSFYSDFSAEQIVLLYEQHKEAIDFVSSIIPHKKHGVPITTPMRGVLTRAYYHENHNFLEEIIEIYLKGQIPDTILELGIAEKLKSANMILSLRQRMIVEGKKMTTIDIYALFEKAISYYCKGKSFTKKITPTTVEIYPVATLDKVNQYNPIQDKEKEC